MTSRGIALKELEIRALKDALRATVRERNDAQQRALQLEGVVATVYDLVGGRIRAPKRGFNPRTRASDARTV